MKRVPSSTHQLNLVHKQRAASLVRLSHSSGEAKNSTRRATTQLQISLGKLAYLSSLLRLLISQERYKPYLKLATRRKDAMQDLNENLNKHSQFLPSLLLYPYYIN